MLKKLLTASALACSLLTAASFAAQAGTEIDQRIDTQQTQIREAASNGRLSADEARRDMRALHQIERQRDMMMSRHDSNLTPRDRSMLNHRLSELAHRVMRASHHSVAMDGQMDGQTNDRQMGGQQMNGQMNGQQMQGQMNGQQTQDQSR